MESVGFVLGGAFAARTRASTKNAASVRYASPRTGRRAILRAMVDDESTSSDAAPAEADAPTAPGAPEGPSATPEVASAKSESAVSAKSETVGEDTPTPAPTSAGGRGRGGGGGGRRGKARPDRDVTVPFASLEVGMELDGTVQSIATYGAFIDVGSETDGLVHVSQLSTGYVTKVEDFIKAGEKVKVRVISLNPDKNEFSLTMKPADATPTGGGAPESKGDHAQERARWNAFTYDPKEFVTGTVISVTEYGAFVDIDGPTDGMVHISEMAEGHVESVDSVLSVGDELEVRIVEVDQSRRRISLSMVEWKPPAEQEDPSSRQSQRMVDEANKAAENVPFKSAFELALAQAEKRGLKL